MHWVFRITLSGGLIYCMYEPSIPYPLSIRAMERENHLKKIFHFPLKMVCYDYGGE